MEDFNQPKIIWGEISDKAKFAYDAKGLYVPEATTFLMVGTYLPFLFCYLNSPLSEWLFSKIGTTTGVGTIRWKKYTILELIIPNISKRDSEYFDLQVMELENGKISINDFTQNVNTMIYRLVGLLDNEVQYIESVTSAMNPDY